MNNLQKFLEVYYLQRNFTALFSATKSWTIINYIFNVIDHKIVTHAYAQYSPNLNRKYSALTLLVKYKLQRKKFPFKAYYILFVL